MAKNLPILKAAVVFILCISACSVLQPCQIETQLPSYPLANIPITRAVTSPTSIVPTQTNKPEPTLTPTIIIPTPATMTTLLFTGVIVPARCVQAALDRLGNEEHPYEEVSDIIQSADYAMGTFNAAMSDIPPHTGCVSTYILVGSPQNADALARAGFDGMSVATNHIKDCGLTNCGDRAFMDTLANLNRVGIQTVGAGKNELEALQPLVITIHGVRFGIVSQGQIEQGGVYASHERAGIAHLTQENINSAIQAARKLADVVIFMPHWGPEDSSTPNWIQLNLAHTLVDSGADLVVGNHTHVVQGYQKIDHTWVFYGLGNFVFDQWQRDHQQGVMLLIRFHGTQMLDFEWIPTHVDKDGRVHLADDAESAEIIQRIDQASVNLK